MNAEHYLDQPLRRAVEFIETRFERQLSAVTRWNRFRTPEIETPARFVSLLGPDVALVTHGKYTEQIARTLLRYEAANGTPFTAEDAQLLLAAARCHDWGEIHIGELGVGDIPYDRKNDAHAQVEASVFAEVVGYVEDRYLQAFLRRAYEEVASTKTSRLGGVFDVVERVGYLRTGLKAYQGERGERITNWRGLAGSVLSNQTGSFIDCSETYPFAGSILEENGPHISALFPELLAVDEVPLDPDGLPSYDRGKLIQASKRWNESRFAEALLLTLPAQPVEL